MKAELRVTLTPEELNQIVAASTWLKEHGYVVPNPEELTVIIEKAPAIPVTSGAPVILPVPGVLGKPSTAPIGKIIDGVKITHYGYPGDSSPDSGSMAGLGDHDNKLTPNVSVALTHSQRQEMFGVTHPSTGKDFSFAGGAYRDDDTAPESDRRMDVYDPYYEGRDAGCTDEMYAKSRSEMVHAGILTA